MVIGVAVLNLGRLGFGWRGVICGEIDKGFADRAESDDYDYALIGTWCEHGPILIQEGACAEPPELRSVTAEG